MYNSPHSQSVTQRDKLQITINQHSSLSRKPDVGDLTPHSWMELKQGFSFMTRIFHRQRIWRERKKKKKTQHNQSLLWLCIEKSKEHKMWHGKAINTLLCSAHTPAKSDSKMRRNGWICKQPWFRAGLQSRGGACVGAISACLYCSYMCICHAYVRVDGAAGRGLLRHTCVHCACVR